MKTQEEIEQLAEDFSNDAHGSPTATFLEKGFIHGYTQCQEDMADERKMIMETLLKIRDCKDYGNNSSTLAKELINSLNKQD
jgi:hypothetical protein